jgi:predicted methyltransferase
VTLATSARALAAACFVLGCAASAARSSDPVPHATAAPFAATPGSAHDFADVEQWRRVFDDPQRDAWQKPRELVAALELRPGMWVADLGAGTGYFSRWLDAAVRPSGVVFAVDTEPNLVAHLRTRSEQEKTSTVVPVLASFDDPRLPPHALDLVLIVDTYHHLDDRLTYLRRLATTLKPSGRVAIVDWQKHALPIGPPAEHKLARDQVVAEMTAAGYRLVAEPKVLRHQYVLVFGRNAD